MSQTMVPTTLLPSAIAKSPVVVAVATAKASMPLTTRDLDAVLQYHAAEMEAALTLRLLMAVQAAVLKTMPEELSLMLPTLLADIGLAQIHVVGATMLL